MNTVSLSRYRIYKKENLLLNRILNYTSDIDQKFEYKRNIMLWQSKEDK